MGCWAGFEISCPIYVLKSASDAPDAIIFSGRSVAILLLEGKQRL
jgi:hypothetical protein